MIFFKLPIIVFILLNSAFIYAENIACKSVLAFQRNDLMILNEIVTEKLGYSSLNEFKEDQRMLAYEFNPMPNYFRSGFEFNLHYRLIIHFEDFSTTVIYDSAEKEVRENQMHLEW